MFDRPHHQRIARVLAALNGDLLRQHSCLLGGGTCIEGWMLAAAARQKSWGF